MTGNLVPPPERAFPAGRLQLRKEQLVSHIHTEQEPPVTASRPRRFVLGMAGLAAAASVAAAVVLFGSGGAGPNPAAAAVLRHAAQSAAGVPATDPPSPGEFVYTKSESSNESTNVPANGVAINVVQHVVLQVWIGLDGSGRLRQDSDAAHFATAADHAAWIAAGKPDVLGANRYDENFKAGGLSYVDLSGLPTDPAQLRQQIESRAIEDGPPGNAETFTIIGDLLRETYASPALRAALYTVAAELPGVRLVGSVQDELGRSGTAVAYDKDGVSQQLIFDPNTSQVLAERSVALERTDQQPFAVGTVLSWTAYLASGVVDSTSATTAPQP